MKKLLRLGIVFTFVVLIVLFLLLVSCSIVIVFRKDGIEASEIYDHHSRKFYSPSSRSSSAKEVNIHRNMENELDDFIDDGESNFVSKVGSMSSYYCTGECYCSESEVSTRRILQVSSSIVKPIFYLLSATSSIIAFNLAKKHFDEECVNLLSSSSDKECSHDKIRSNVRTCKKRKPKVKEEFDEFQTQEEIYFCDGHCRWSDDMYELIKYYDDEQVDLSEEEHQKLFELCEGELEDVQITSFYEDKYVGVRNWGKKKEMHNDVSPHLFMLRNTRAGIKFINQHLRAFCRKKGVRHFPNDFEVKKLAGRKTNLCIEESREPYKLCFRATPMDLGQEFERGLE